MESEDLGGWVCGRNDDPGPSPALCSTWGTKAGRRIGALCGATAVGERDGGVCHGRLGCLRQGVCICRYSQHLRNPGEESREPYGRCKGLFICSFSKNLPLRISYGPGLFLGNARDTSKDKGLREFLVQSRREQTHCQRMTAHSEQGWGGGLPRQGDQD